MEAPFDLSGRRAFITGTASGIGRATAIQFAQAGATVICADINADGANDTASLARAAGPGDATAVQLDVRDPARVNEVIENGPALDVLCNIAGVIAQSSVEDITIEMLDRILDVNVKGVLLCSQAAIPGMKAAGRGSVINLTSAAIDAVTPNVSAYSLSKAAVAQLTRSMAVEWAGYGVRVNAVAPGFIDTPMTYYRYRKADGSVDEERRTAHLNAVRKHGPLKMVGQPDDVAATILFLAADASRFMTGQILRPNGGVAMPW